jgi:hypothetical protein
MRRIAIASCAALAALGGGVALAAGASGDQRAIAFYRASRTAMAAYEGIAFTGRGTAYEPVPQGGVENFRFDFGSTPAGYHAAVAHVQIVQVGGVVREEVDTLRAPGLPALRLWQGGTVEVGELLTKGRRCAELVPRNTASYTTLGKPWVALSGAFAKLEHPAAGLTVVRSTYPLAGGSAHETDTIASASHLWQASRVVVSGGPLSGAHLSETRFSYRRVQGILQPPVLHACP